jgi:SH3-like domain-containing protein
LLASLLIFGIASHSLSTEKPNAILMEMNAYVKSAPSMQSEDLFILHEGAKVEVIEIFKDWTKIKLSDGMIGWLKTDDLERI